MNDRRVGHILMMCKMAHRCSIAQYCSVANPSALPISARSGNVVCKYILPPTGSLRFTPQRLSDVGKKTDVSYDVNSHVLNDTMRAVF